MSEWFEDLKYDIMEGLANFLWNLGDRIENSAKNAEIDEEDLTPIPRYLVEKKRKTKPPAEGIFPCCLSKTIEVTADRIKVHRILDGFDNVLIQRTKDRIVDACTFILGNAGNEAERHIAGQLAKMLWKGAVIITDAELVMDRKMAGCFYTREGMPYIGLDIAAARKADDAALVNTLVHEAYHAWRYFTSETEYSVVDETRAWNIALAFSNRYRNMYGIPLEQEKEYTEAELFRHEEYLYNANVKVRSGPGENIIENIGYGIINLIEDATDVVSGWTDKIMDKTLQG